MSGEVSDTNISLRKMAKLVSNHTPGPWKADFTHIGHVKAENGAVIAKCSKLTSLVNLEANTRLIAAAPELLEALKAMLALVKDHPDFQGRQHIGLGIQVTNAIAKAEGRA